MISILEKRIFVCQGSRKIVFLCNCRLFNNKSKLNLSFSLFFVPRKTESFVVSL